MSPLLQFHSTVRYGGGPAGYLFELRAALAERGSDAILVTELPFVELPLGRPNLFSRAISKVGKAGVVGWSPSRVPAEVYAAMQFNRMRMRATLEPALAELRSRAQIIVHDVFAAAELIRRDKAWVRDRVCLMTHSPTFFVRQTAADLLEEGDEPPGGQRLIRHFTDWEEEVMSSVRSVIWPCAEAMDGYVATAAGGLTSVRHEFCQTGVGRPDVMRDREEMRRDWGVRPDQKVILFLGRPHPHKGFPIFERMAETAKALGREDLVFIWGGRDRHRPLPSAARHIGFVKENGSALLAADLNVIPNTVTYMDIGVLQALSLGAPILLSDRGGNRTVARYVEGLPTFDPDRPQDAMVAIDGALEKFKIDPGLQHRMVTAWQTWFSPEAMAENHLALAQRLVS